MVAPEQLLRRVQVALVEDHDGLAVLQLGDGRHPVDKERVGDRDSMGGDEDHLIHIGHGGALELVLAWVDGVQATLARLGGGDVHPVAHQGRHLLIPELPTGLALDDVSAAVHVVEPAEGFYDEAGHEMV